MARLIIIEDNHELATLIASTARSRGHEAEVVHAGQAALRALDEKKFDAAVVDLLLPDIRGSEVLTELSARAIPAIAMSGVYKGDRFAQEAVQVHGAVAFFEKPFAMNALIEALEKAARVTPTAPVAAEDDLEELEPLSDEIEIDLATTPGQAAPPPVLEEEVSTAVTPPDPERLRVLREASPETKPPILDDETPTRVEDVRHKVDTRPALLPLAIPEDDIPTQDPKPPWALPDPSVPLVEVPLKPSAKAMPEWVRSGDLKSTSVPRLLNAYYAAQHFGELKLKQGAVLKVVYFESGWPVYAASNLAQERFAKFCAKRGVLPESELRAVGELAKEQGIRTGEAMVRLELVSEEKRKELLEDQVREIIWSTFRWTDGEYSFAAKKPGRSDLVKLKVFPGDLILQGTAREFPLVELRQRMPARRRLFPAPDPPYEMQEIHLSGAQALLLAQADGSKVVEDLLTLTDLNERDALATLLGLEFLGILEERRAEVGRRISFGL